MIKIFTPVWNKYRPAILKMMVDSLESPQEYKLSAHEFKAMNTRLKSGFNFTLQVSKGKAINNIRDSVIARELLEVLQLSRKASELTDEAPYQFELDKHFVLRITKLSAENTN